MSKPENTAVIVAYGRTPFTPAYKGALRTTRADDMTAQLIRGLLKKVKLNENDIEDLILGCAFPEAEQGFNPARLITFLADLPRSVGGVTLNRFCGSSMQSIHYAAGNIASGMGEVFICAGMEQMSHIPMSGFNPMPNPELAENMPAAYMGMGETAENVVTKYKLTREEMDAFAFTSHQKAAKAQRAGAFKKEIIPIFNGKKTIKEDGCIRAETTQEKLGTLKPAFLAEGSVTAGTSSPLTDGAAAVIVTSEAYAKKHKLPMMAKIKSFAVSGCAPEIMGIGPVGATQKALERAGLKMDDIDVVELNEAFASQSIAVIRDLNIPLEKINIDGGAISMGHPLGATGARITGKAAEIMVREKKKYALSTQCIGGGQGIATILEAI